MTTVNFQSTGLFYVFKIVNFKSVEVLEVACDTTISKFGEHFNKAMNVFVYIFWNYNYVFHVHYSVFTFRAFELDQMNAKKSRVHLLTWRPYIYIEVFKTKNKRRLVIIKIFLFLFSNID